ncbi:MAG: CpaF family protein [Butyrivibrio sp.]|nr:CpaF family protein [Butyrivibrio sp.]
MGELTYKKISQEKHKYTSRIYHVDSMYSNKKLQNEFINLRANIVDLNPALITKCIQGTEQDFIMLMNRAKDFLESTSKLNDAGRELLLDMFSDCVFGYYILTPLIKSKDVSDIKVYSWNHITCKANGDRFVTDLSFSNEEDYNRWFDRITRIHKLQRTDDNALQHCTDRKGVENYYLRIDVELASIVSTEYNNIHIRKIPKEKYSWDYLKREGMLNDEMIEYLEDRIVNGYSFLLSGKGGSGKTSLLNNMIDLIPFGESILVSQESDELYSNIHPQIQFEHTLEIKREGIKTEYTLEDELRQGLLQDIDNFTIGEIKGGEALYVFTTGMSTGARFMGTIHSNNARSSTNRLAYCARFISDYPVDTLLEMLTNTPFSLIHMSRFSIDEIVEIDGWDEENNRLLFNQIYLKKWR